MSRAARVAQAPAPARRLAPAAQRAVDRPRREEWAKALPRLAAATCAERGESELRILERDLTEFGERRALIGIRGRCPIGRRSDDEGKSGVSAGVAGGWAAAAAPWQGSAIAGGATPTATQSPIAAADAIDIEAIRRRGDMSHLSGGTTSL